jgi:hypothetical protein
MEVPTYTEIVEPLAPVTVYNKNSDGSVSPETKYGWRKYTVPGEPMRVEGYAAVA